MRLMEYSIAASGISLLQTIFALFPLAPLPTEALFFSKF